MTNAAINTALVNQRNIWLAGLAAGSKIIFRSTYTSKVVCVDRTTKTLIILSNGFRASRKTGTIIGEDGCREIRQLLTCSPQFQPGIEWGIGYTLNRGEERAVEECILEFVITGMPNSIETAEY